MADPSTSSAQALQTGTFAFLFTDIEGSTRRWEQYPEQMHAAIARHDALLREAIEANGGHVFKTIGDAFCAAFVTASNALDAALAAQRAVHTEGWGAVGELWVRMALHSGTAETRDNDYFGSPLRLAAQPGGAPAIGRAWRPGATVAATLRTGARPSTC